MEQRLSLVTLCVEDLDRARDFYERLGWTRSVKAAEGVAFFRAGGVVLGLYPREAQSEDAGIELDAGGHPRVSLAHNVRSRDEVDRVLAEVAAAGATVVKPGADVFWGGYVGYFTDPDGILWEVAWNPGFPIADDGHLTLPD